MGVILHGQACMWAATSLHCSWPSSLTKTECAPWTQAAEALFVLARVPAAAGGVCPLEGAQHVQGGQGAQVAAGGAPQASAPLGMRPSLILLRSAAHGVAAINLQPVCPWMNTLNPPCLAPHRYLTTLQKGLAAWAALHARRQQKRSATAAMRRHCQLALLRRALAAWRGPFLAAARRRRQQASAAEAHWRARLAGAAFRAWRGPFLAATRARRLAVKHAQALWRANALHATVAAWRQYVVLRRAKHARADELRERLAPGRRRRALRAWRLAAEVRTARRQQVGAERAVPCSKNFQPAACHLARR